MKIGFSSLACPTWDFKTIVAKAAEYGFDGVELRGLKGELHLPLVPELASAPAAVKQQCADNNVQLVCLGTSTEFTAKDRKTLSSNKATAVEFIELANALECPFVRVFVGQIPKRDYRYGSQARAAEALLDLATVSARQGVTILLENGGDFCDSGAMWYVSDAVDHPGLKICWNPATGAAVPERPSISIPRLGRRIGMVHVCDGVFDTRGGMERYALPGEGTVEISRMIELLRGVVFQGFLMFEWPKLWVPELAGPDEALPKVASWLRERVDEKQVILTAYKGDKKPSRFEPLEAS